MRKGVAARISHIVAIVLIAYAGGGVGNSSAAEGISEEQGSAILQELKQIRLLLEAQRQTTSMPSPAPANGAKQTVKLPMSEAFSIGNDQAPLTLVEFTDYQCPFCNAFHEKTFPELKKNFIDTGLVRFVSRDLPLDFHKHAFEAARAARCAGEQGKYWELRDRLSSNPKHITPDSIQHFGEESGLDSHLLQACLQSERYREDIRKDISEAKAIGITGTPGFVLGQTADGVLEGVKIVGAQPYETFEARINQLLNDKKP